MVTDLEFKESEDVFVTVCVLKFGDVYKYTVPSFSVVTVYLRHAVVQRCDADGAVENFDMFFREDDSLEAALPMEATCIEACLVEVRGKSNRNLVF